MDSIARRQFWLGFNITALVLSLGFLTFVPTVQALIPHLQTVDIYLAPTLEESVYALTLDNPKLTPLNALEFELFFDPKVTSIHDIVLTPLLCEERFVITSTIDNKGGRAFVQCGTVTPFVYSTGTVAFIQASGPVPRFGYNTHVLAHDGLGTDATRHATIR